jgi:hypothetical protein
MLFAVLVAMLVSVPASSAAPAPGAADSLAAALREYQSLLDHYVRRLPAGDTRLDYEQIYVDDHIWTEHRSARLERIHAGLLSARPSEMSEAQRTAWALNTYNFLVIERITANLLIANRRFQRYDDVTKILATNGPFFFGKVARVDGREYNLDEFERRFVRGDTTSGHGPPADPADWRLPFAINPGRIGYPPVPPRAFRADSLDRQLDDAVRRTLAQPRFLALEHAGRSLTASDWFFRSLGWGPDRVLARARDFGPAAVRRALASGAVRSVGRFTPLDPLLNQMPHAKVLVEPPGAGAGS